MNQQDFIISPQLGYVILNVIADKVDFKNLFKETASSIAADIESASTNPTCSCRNKVISYVNANTVEIGTLLYNFAINNNVLAEFETLFTNAKPPEGQPISGKVAKTTMKEWPAFVESLNRSNFVFKHVSTSVVGEEVFVFFI
jgi:hypothetical protein